MKAKLSKTKIQDSAVSQVSDTGPQLKNFNKPPIKTHESEKQAKPFVPRAASNVPKQQQITMKPKQHPVQLDIPNDDELAAANAAMMAKQTYTTTTKVQKLSQSSTKGGEYEERKTTVINTSKNIYKPSFNLPQKEVFDEPAAKKNKSQRAPAKSSVQQRKPSAKRPDSKSDVRSSQPKIFSKPIMSAKPKTHTTNVTESQIDLKS